MAYNRAAIRVLISEAFDDDALKTFCSDHFPAVYREFTAGQSQGQRVLDLLGYAERSGQIERLLDAIAGDNPYQFGLYAEQVRADPMPPSGLTADQAAALFTRTLGVLQDSPVAREMLIGGRASLAQARQQIKLLAEYKSIHDLLQQLELGYRIVYDLVFEHDVPLPAERVSWRGLASSQMALLTTVDKVCAEAAAVSFSSDTAGWADELRAARGQLDAAHGQRDVARFATAVTAVADVIGSQMSRMNDRLIGALDALGLADLLGLLRRGYTAMAGLPLEGGAGLPASLERFAQDLEGLAGLTDRLRMLRREHDDWQQMDNALRSEEALLGLSLDRFRRRWERLAPQLRALCAGTDADWARSLDAAIGQMAAALAPGCAADPMDALYACRSAVIRRFNQVDHDLKGLCDLLKEAGGPLDTMLEGLA